VVYDPDRPEVFATAEQVRSEYVLRVTGRVRRRPEGTENPKMATGQIEVLGHELEILNPSETPPRRHPSSSTTSRSPKSIACAIATSICAARACSST